MCVAWGYHDEEELFDAGAAAVVQDADALLCALFDSGVWAS